MDFYDELHARLADALHHFGLDAAAGVADTVLATQIMEHRNGGCIPICQTTKERLRVVRP